MNLLCVCETVDGLKIVFCDETKHVKTTYPTQSLAYRCCDEADRWKCLSKILLENGENYFRENLFSIVEHSDFKKWFLKESSFCYKEEQIQHHAFVTQNDVIEVLAVDYPTVEMEKCYCNTKR